MAGSWAQAENDFRRGNYECARRALTTLRRSRSTPLERAAIACNLQAVEMAGAASGKWEEIGNRCVAAAVAAGVGAGERNVEVVLSARYNASLALMKAGKVRDGVREVERAAAVILAFLRSLQVGGERKKRRKKRRNVEKWKEEMMEAKRVVQLLDVEGVGEGRWIEAAVDVLGLLTAAYIMTGKVEEASVTASVGESFERLAVLLKPIGAAKSETGHEVQDIEEIKPDETENDNDIEAGDSDVSSDYVQNDGILDGGRRRVMLALLHATKGEWGEALNVLRFDRENALCNSAYAPSYWPAAYLCGILLLCRGTPDDVKDAVQLLDACASTFYRSADATAMSARAVTGEDALERWKRVLAIDHVRPAALWGGAEALAQLGRHSQRSRLLACLRQVLQIEQACPTVSPATDNIFSHKVTLPLQHSRFAVTKEAVSKAIAYASCSSGSWSNALEAIDCALSESHPAEELHDLLRNKVWVLSAAGMPKRALDVVDEALNKAEKGIDRAACLLAKAEVLTALERVNEALRSVETAFDEAQLAKVASFTPTSRGDSTALRFLRGLCYNNRGVLLACQGNIRDADESFTAGELAFEKCSKRDDSKDESRDELAACAADFSMAASFNRCLTLWRRRAGNDAVKHWLKRREIPEDAEGKAADDILQQAKALLNGSQAMHMTSSHIPGELGRLERAKMDIFSIEKRRATVAKEKAGAFLDDLERNW